MKLILSFTAFVFIGLIAYLALWPVPIDPVSWQAPEDKGYVGAFAVNQRLDALKFVPLGENWGPEDVAVGPNGKIHMATHAGNIAVIDLASGAIETIASTGGRPLGIEFAPDGTLIIADSFVGLLAMSKDGTIKLLTDKTADGSRIRYANNVAVAADGVVYFSDASTKFSAKAEGGTLEASLLDLMEHGPNGRLLKYDPHKDLTEVIYSGLSYANGVALADDESYLLIVETGTYSVLRLWLKGVRAGELETVTANLPGFPDNIAAAGDGTYWLGLASPRSAPMDGLSNKPFLRSVVQRLPSFLRPKPQRYGHIVRIDGNGKVLETLQGPDGTYALNTGARPGPGGSLIVTSLTERRLGYLQPGWEN